MTGATAIPPGLHDIVLPDPVSWLPQTPGWAAVAVLAGGLTAWAIRRWLHRRQAGRYRREALAQLAGIERDLADPVRRPAALAALPALVKRTALVCRPRTEVASLTGPQWLEYLDRSYGGNGFTRGAGSLLTVLAYSPPATVAAVAGRDLQALLGLIRDWIRRHHAGV